MPRPPMRSYLFPDLDLYWASPFTGSWSRQFLGYVAGMKPPYPLVEYDYHDHPWAVAAKGWLDSALDDLISGYDPQPSLEAALICLKIEAHELPDDYDEDLLFPPE